jgi:hypothetical protein
MINHTGNAAGSARLKRRGSGLLPFKEISPFLLELQFLDLKSSRPGPCGKKEGMNVCIGTFIVVSIFGKFNPAD